MEENKLRIVVFLGSVREGRLADRVKLFLEQVLRERNHQVMVLDPKELNLGSVRQPVHFYRRPADAPDVLHQLNKAVQDADAFIVVAAEYNSAISPALSAMMDHFPPLSYAYRPSAIVTYSMGQFGGLRAAMQLRQYLSELLTIHMPHMLTISNVHQTLSENGEPADDGILQQATNRMLGDLEWYARALQKEKQISNVPR